MAASGSIQSIQARIRSGDLVEALEAARSSLNSFPNDYRLWTLEGIVLSIQHRDAEALQAFEKALQISPSYTAALKGAAQLYSQAQDKRAIPLLQTLLAADPKDGTAQEMLANLEQHEGDCAAAEEHFAQIAQAIANHPSSLEAYGGCLVETGHPADAVPIYSQLVSLLPDRTYAQYDLALAMVEAKQNDAALKVLEPLLALQPPDPDVLSLASEAYEASGDTPKAVALLRQAIVLNPASAPYYTAFAAICLDHESFQVGIDMIDAGLKHISNDPSLYISRGLLYAQIAEYDKAEADFKTAERIDSKQSISSYAIDLAELQKNNSGSALTQVRSQLAAHPESALLHYLLAKLLSSEAADASPEEASKALEEARQSALIALKLKPDLIEARDLLAAIFTDNGQYPLAIEQCRLALQSNPGDQTAIYRLIVALRHSGDDAQRAEIPVLVKRLAELQKTSRQQETDRKRFKLVEQSAPPAP